MILESVKKNKAKTFGFLALFFVFVALFIYFIGLLFFEDPIVALVMGLGFSFFSTFFSYYNSDKMVLSLNGARKATKEENAQIIHSLEGLCIAAGLSKVPELYIMEDSAMNAFATGRNPEHSVICVTTGLLNRLDKYELEGVLAHELSHIRNYDILLQTVIIVTVGMVVMLADFASRTTLKNSDDDNKASGILAIIGIIFVVLSPIFSKLLQLAISRNREYLADASAVELTRNKDGLISALEKISGDTEALEQAYEATESLYIISPFKEKREKDNLLSTHPATSNRIARLRNIQ